MTLSREELKERYNKPVQLGWEDDNRVVVFVHESQEAAQAYADANTEHHGHPSHVEYRQVWVNVINLGPAIDQAEKDFNA